MKALWLVLACVGAFAQSKQDPIDKFRQLEEILPTPNAYRTASGAPGHEYWQQRADYQMDLVLDDERQRLSGSAKITYYNESPDTLRYLWVQLDQNRFEPGSDDNITAQPPDFDDKPRYDQINRILARESFDGGYKISKVVDKDDKPLPYTIVKTMMRIDLPAPLKPGQQVVFGIDWSYNIIEENLIGGRGGWEYFPKDGNYLYEIAQFFPRMAAYTDVNGWHHKQFLGSGEFTLEFGDYDVSITAPADHIVASTGVLQNPDDVLTAQQRRRLKDAETSDTLVLVVTEEEAIENEKEADKDTKTWRYKAENVRDFAFASSRKFIWDAQGYKQADGTTVLAMSYYPKEGNPLWERYSTESIIHTLEQYNYYTFIYPYPVAISVNGPVGGMEYPMICFNGPRPEEDKTYTRRTKYGLISVIIHEIGHNYFPMIVNSDERQWTWMDEGLNSFLQYIAEQAWEDNYPSRRGEPYKITDYMESDRQMPIMTNSDSVLRLGPNAYSKPATALNILRETVIGRDLFDFAFREYARRWQFKRPMPADFFRTMEDASGVDLDWFWRGWFYTTDHVDLSISGLKQYQINSRNPDVEQDLARQADDAVRKSTIGYVRNRELARRADAKPELKDFYNENDSFTVAPADVEKYERLVADLEEDERKLLDETRNFYVVDFKNHGGLVMPIILKVNYADGFSEELRMPAEIWRRNQREVSKLIITERQIESIMLDPNYEIADVNMDNNHFPPKVTPSRFELFKREQRRNLMRLMNEKTDESASVDASVKEAKTSKPAPPPGER